MPKSPSDETKMRTEETEPSALRQTTRAAAADGPRPHFSEMGAARAPMPAPMRKRGAGVLPVLFLLVAAATAAAVWFFFFR